MRRTGVGAAACARESLRAYRARGGAGVRGVGAWATVGSQSPAWDAYLEESSGEYPRPVIADVEVPIEVLRFHICLECVKCVKTGGGARRRGLFT